jgi:hypothetical protein
MRTLFIFTGEPAITRHIRIQNDGEFAGVGVLSCLVRRARFAQAIY